VPSSVVTSCRKSATSTWFGFTYLQYPRSQNSISGPWISQKTINPPKKKEKKKKKDFIDKCKSHIYPPGKRIYNPPLKMHV
jgi:hypothetical protein